MTTETKARAGVYASVVLGMLTAFGPFVTDFYLPVLPEMAGYFGSSAAAVAMSLTTGMIGLAAGQIFIGPLTDKYGRRWILVGAMLLFVLASIGCIFAKSVVFFNVMRLFQGLGGAGGIVISKCMASDMFTGEPLARFMALLGAINGVAPVVAPVVGGVMASFASWQGVFALLLVLGIVLMFGCLGLKETLVPERRIDKPLTGIYINLFRVFRNRLFTLTIVFTIFGAMCFFSYIASSAFILQDVYGLSALGFSLCFGLNALMIALGAGLAATLRSQRRALGLAALVQLTGAVGSGVCLLLHAPVWVLMAAYVVMMGGFGLWQPGAAAVAIDSERHNSGAASAIFGASIFAGGGLASAIAALGDVSVMASVCAVGGALLALIAFIPLAPALRAYALSRGRAHA